ncbi:MAG: serine/threonine-protein kinase [Verrucomicrobiales bacterium]|nr:serine/threonine-protein kinase [Verrucomicrobiales bacterium]
MGNELTMLTQSRCPACGAIIPPSGQCINCLLALGLDDVAQPRDESNHSTQKRQYPSFPGYEIQSEVARGAMGIVYRARQVKPNRIVALKVVTSGQFASNFEIARFQQEAEAAASLDHPNIVSIYHVGEHEGRPFFTMPLIEGGTVMAPCKCGSVSGSAKSAALLRDAATMMAKVARAVHHAHERGILHRDLKPSNILLDAQGEPHVTDFGLAKRVGSSVELTVTGAALGTPGYMAPEQASGESKQATTAADIFSLGAIIYELITGRPPFQADTTLAIVRKTIEEEPKRPSAIRQKIDCDLETICLKCLSKDPARRYRSAEAMAEDLEHWIRNEPITARPPSGLYRLHAFARRNKLAFSAAAAFLLAVFGGLVLSTWSFWREKAARTMAQTEATKSRQVAQFLNEMLNGVGPSVALGRDTRLVREIVGNASERVGRELANQPEVEAQLRSTLCRVYYDLGDYGEAEAMGRRALELRRRLFGLEHTDVAASLHDLGKVLLRQRKYSQAESMTRECLTIRRKSVGDQHALTTEALNSLGKALLEQAKFVEAERTSRESLAICRMLFVHEDEQTTAALDNLATALHGQYKYGEAEPVYREALSEAKMLFHDDHPEIARLLNDLGALLADQARLPEAEVTLRDAVAMRRKLLNQAHPDYADSVNALVDVLLKERKYRETDELFAQDLTPAFERDPGAARLLRTRARSFARLRRWKDAAAEFNKVIEFEPENHWNYLYVAPLLVEIGDLGAYRRLCARMVAQFSDTKDFVIAERMAKASLLVPIEGSDLDVVTRHSGGVQGCFGWLAWNGRLRLCWADLVTRLRCGRMGAF